MHCTRCPLVWQICIEYYVLINMIFCTGDYWVTVAQDYKEVAIDVVAESRRRPLKASVYVSCEFAFTFH